MTPLSALADLCAALETSPGRLDKLRLVADFVGRIEPDEVATAVAFLTGRAFPASDPRVLGVRGLPDAAPAETASLTLGDVAEAFAGVASSTGAGSRRAREVRLTTLAERATAAEQQLLWRIITGEMRNGVSDGLVLDAIGRAVGAGASTVRRAALLLGDLSVVGTLARSGGPEALAAVTPRLFVPLSPMLAEPTASWDGVLAAHGGRTSLEYKYDGARIQLHADGDRVAIWTRGLSDVTRSLPDVVEIARHALSGASLILDGEVVALDGSGRPLPFQELMRRFRRVHGVEALAREMPLGLFFFDCLVAGGRALIDEPYEARLAALADVTRGRYLAQHLVVETADQARAFHARAVAAGHEGVIAKDLRSTYEPGSRGKRWFKIKEAQSVDCVIVAVDRGSGRRRGWLSNYHLAVRQDDGFADVGKTFKGFTDRQFAEMTERLHALAVADDGYTVRVRPEVVVDVAYNEIQKSPSYPSGFALRFARITRVRDDKAPRDATTLEELRRLYEAQFASKGRAAE